MAKNILRRQFSNMYGKNKPYQNPEPIPVEKSPVENLPKLESPSMTITGVLLYSFFLFVFILMYLNRSSIYTFFENIYNDFKPAKGVDDLEEKYHRLFNQYKDASMNNTKIDEILDKGNKQMDSIESRDKRLMDSLETREKRLIELLEKNQGCNTIEQKEKEQKDTEKKQEHSAVNQLNEKISGYTKEQTVTSNGFCYIGYDQNYRDCTSVSAGDICMSGQVFPSLDVCLYPKFRHEGRN